MTNSTKVLIDDALLHSMLDKTQYGADEQPLEFWFSRNKQKQHIFELGSKLLESDSSLTPADAITLAQQYVDTFYEMVLSTQSWKTK
tara:strand:- start:2092 stop:2352 length:261 start_codon:yes stop_codon:yes gene_type:complete